MPRKTSSILLVENDTSLQANLKRLLEDDGHAVARTCDAGEAADAIEAGLFDLLVIDVLFPGRRTLEALMERNRRVAPHRNRIVGLSHHDRTLPPYYLSLIEKIGVRAILAKPFDRPRLSAAVARAMLD